MIAPEFLAGPALDKWREVTSLVVDFNPDLLAAYCSAYGRWVQAERWLADPDHGTVVTICDDKGNVKTHGPAPQLAICEKSLKEMARLAKDLRLDAKLAKARSRQAKR